VDYSRAKFEECKRWANSDAGQAARMTNPAGFANVRAHAQAHLRAMAPVAQPLLAVPQAAHLRTSSTAVRQRVQREISPRSDERDAPGDHWVTIDGHHVLIHEPQGNQNGETAQNLAAQIPCDVKALIARALTDSNTPTADDKKGGFHEEYGVAGLDASGKWVVSRDRPGPYRNPDVDKDVSPSRKPADQVIANSIVQPRVVFHVHPSGTTEAGKGWVQPPSDADKVATIPGQINIVLAAREKRVYFYDKDGIIDKPIKLKDFLCK
jgi:hypothetical protein